MLKINDLSLRVGEDNTEIIKNLELEIKDGEILVLTGPNGGGKSTIAKVVMGIAAPYKGTITLDGQDITALDVTERAKLGIGYAFQAPARFKGITVKKLLTLAAGKEIPDRECCGYLSRVGLCANDYLNRILDGTLSGGELKRIEVASLLIRELKLAMYDEPEAGIDMWSFNMLVNAFKSLGRERSGSLLIISHQERLMQLADRIAVIADGKVKEIGTREKMLPLLTDLFSRECIRTK
ncbi:MAG: ATP-binding cassette domain-containing protein [Clostridia bacterium]|nr:ATP-binding cassette domain-containing protein [Clostridia bacterium]